MNKMYYFIVRFGNDFNNFAIFDNYAEAKRFCDIFYNKNSFIIEKKLNFFGWINLFHIFKKTI